MIIFLPFPQQQVMAPETLQPGAIGAASSRMTGASTKASPGEIQQQHRHHFVDRITAIVATENMTQDEHLNTLCESGSSKNKKQHMMECESIHIDVHDGQLTI